MKKIKFLTISLVLLFCSSVFASRLDNNSKRFVNQPCFGMDNYNPSESANIISSEHNYVQRPQSDIDTNTEYQKQTIKCRINQVVFYTSLTLENFLPLGDSVLIKYHYAHDGNDYFLIYDANEELYRPYTTEELNAVMIGSQVK